MYCSPNGKHIFINEKVRTMSTMTMLDVHDQCRFICLTKLNLVIPIMHF